MTGSGIYEIRHVESGKRYIGSAKNFAKRWKAHRNHLIRGTHHAPHLQRAWAKYGESSFQFNILELCEPHELLDREQGWFDLSRPEYNVCPTAYSTAGRIHSPETREKIAKSKAGLKLPPRSDEYKAKLSALHKGKKKPEHVMRALQNGRASVVYSEDRRLAVSEGLRKSYKEGRRSREKSEEHCHKIGKFYAKLSDDQVREIKKLRAEGVTCKALAIQFDSNAPTICNIANGKRYRWVE